MNIRSIICGLQLFSISLPRYGPFRVHLCLISSFFKNFCILEFDLFQILTKERYISNPFHTLNMCEEGWGVGVFSSTHEWVMSPPPPAMLELHSIITFKIPKEIIKCLVFELLALAGYEDLFCNDRYFHNLHES